MAYSFTDRGKQIAEACGLDLLVERLALEEPNLIIERISDDLSIYHENSEFSKAKDASVRKVGNLLLPNVDEYRQFVAGLLLDGRSIPMPWQYNTQPTNNGDKLFPVTNVLNRNRDTSEEDAMILSGTVGLGLRHRHSLRNLLSVKGYESFGFQSRVDAASFAGAWVVNSLQEKRGFWRLHPSASFSYFAGNSQHTLILGGDLHGDFRMSEVKESYNGVITPLNRFAEFSPKEVISVAGYHSTETTITDAMLEIVFLSEGEKGLRQFLDELVEVGQSFSTTSGADVAGPGVHSGFADYGGDHLDGLYDCFWLYMYQQDGYKNDLGQPGEVRPLHSSSYLPGSSVNFELHGDAEGIYLGMSEGDVQYQTISIPRKHFADLYDTLLRQASVGAGRTSPDQHIRVLNSCLAKLNGDE